MDRQATPPVISAPRALKLVKDAVVLVEGA